MGIRRIEPYNMIDVGGDDVMKSILSADRLQADQRAIHRHRIEVDIEEA